MHHVSSIGEYNVRVNMHAIVLKQPPDTGQNVALAHEISHGVETHLETRITPRETDIFTASDLEKPVGADMALDLETSQGAETHLELVITP